jgi:lactoylglutathione lyase
MENKIKFGYTIFYVASPKDTLKFYEDAFGLETNFYHESGYGELKTGATKSFEMAKKNGFESLVSKSGDYPFEIALVTEDVDGATAAGAKPRSEPQQKPWGQTVGYVEDINGALVELYSPMKN